MQSKSHGHMHCPFIFIPIRNHQGNLDNNPAWIVDMDNVSIYNMYKDPETP